jgi:diacylglycerol kinase (ATP)
MDRAIVIANSAAGRGHNRRRLRQVERWCARAGVELALTGAAEETLERARQAAAEGFTRVIAAGGDGTVHWVLNGLVGTASALGIIPLGSGNDIARNLGLPLDVEAAGRTALTGAARLMDLGRIRVPSPKSQVPSQVRNAETWDLRPGTLDCYFACIASFGIDSHANRIANRHKRFSGTLIYVYSLVRSLLEYRVPQVLIRGDAGEFSGPMILLAVGNAPSYGGGMRLAPNARMDDGRLDLVMVRDMSRLRLLRCFPEVYLGTHLRHPEASCVQTAEVHIEADRPLDIFADGEFVGLTPAHIEVLPGALPFIAPNP